VLLAEDNAINAMLAKQYWQMPALRNACTKWRYGSRDSTGSNILMWY